ncbi:MAG: hypothetical protein ACYTFY_21275 [Planctomycetota bacterium]
MVLAEADVRDYHSGANAYFCDGGNKVLNSGETAHFPGNPNHYTGHLDQYFMETDKGFPLAEQGRMGIYRRRIDGSDKQLMVTVDDLLNAHPLGGAMRRAGLLYRLGAEISPNQEKVRLGLLTRSGGFVKDYFTCNLEGDLDLVFHGKLGAHPGWHFNNDQILTFVNPWQTILGEMKEYYAEGQSGGMLGCYNIKDRNLKIVSTYKVNGGSHIAPSPDGDHVVMDSYDYERMTVSILLCSQTRGNTVEVCTAGYNPPELAYRQQLIRAGDPTEKKYDVSAHPVFSRDGTKIIFNSCSDGVVRLKEISDFE